MYYHVNYTCGMDIVILFVRLSGLESVRFSVCNFFNLSIDRLTACQSFFQSISLLVCPFVNELIYYLFISHNYYLVLCIADL